MLYMFKPSFWPMFKPSSLGPPYFGRVDDTVGNPHRDQIYKFELFELILLLKLDTQIPVEQFEATVSQSRAPSPLLLVLHKAVMEHMGVCQCDGRTDRPHVVVRVALEVREVARRGRVVLLRLA